MKTWETTAGPIDEDFVRDVETGIWRGFDTAGELVAFLGPLFKPHDRRIDRALQLLKKAGRIRYDHHLRRWSVTTPPRSAEVLAEIAES